MLLTANWNYPTLIKFGPGRIRELNALCRASGILRPLLVTDAGLANMPMVANVLKTLPDAGLFCDVAPNPVAENVTAGVAAYRMGGHDGVVALGGGSAMDAGKAIAFMSGQSRPLWDFEDIGDNFLRADPHGIAPAIAVPTTAGTGSEVGRVSVITDSATHTKRLIFHPKVMPVAVIADAELTIGLPPHLTAATGMDALAHCLEAFCAPGFHPMADGIALEGMRLIHHWLPLAVRDGGNIEARANMMAAATMGATAFQKGLGVIHSLAHPLGAHYHAHHGLLNGILMPYVLEFNAPLIADKMIILARLLDLPQSGLLGVLAWIKSLCGGIGIPPTLAAAGVVVSNIGEITAAALVDPTASTNPVPLTEANVRALLLRAMG